MVSFALRRIAFCVLLTPGWVSLVGQSPDYHVALEGNPPCAEPTKIEPQTTDSRQKHRQCPLPRLALVNDSDKSIEAFAASEWCIHGKLGQLRDILIEGPVGMEPDAEGRLPDSLAPGARWRMYGAAPECDQRIEAVLFTDGSFEGQDDGLRALKARRDGMSASVNYWAHRIRPEKSDGSTLGTLVDEAKHRVAEDAAEVIKRGDPTHEIDLEKPLWNYTRLYWESRQNMDRNAQWWAGSPGGEEPASVTFQRLKEQIYRCEKELNDDLALRKLNSIFPQISEQAARDNEARITP